MQQSRMTYHVYVEGHNKKKKLAPPTYRRSRMTYHEWHILTYSDELRNGDPFRMFQHTSVTSIDRACMNIL